MAEIKSIRKIYSDGRHSAFTDTEYWKGHYYVSFRNGPRHPTLPGDLDIQNKINNKRRYLPMKDDRVYKFPLLPPGPGNPQNSGGSIIPLRDGRMFMAYVYAYGKGGDWAASRIAACFSEDDGITWTIVTLSIPKGERNREYKVYLKEVFEDVYSR